MNTPTTRITITLSALALAACTPVSTTSDDAPLVAPPYPPGYTQAESVPDIVAQLLPGDIVEQQVLIADDGCFYYHRGATTFPVVRPDAPRQLLCLEREPVGVPLELGEIQL